MASRSDFEALVERARTLMSAGECDASMSLADEALAKGEATWGPDAPELIDPLCLLAKAQHRKSWDAPDSLERQIELLRRAQAIAKRSVSTDGRTHIRILSTLGDLLLAVGKPHESEGSLREALALVEGADSPDRLRVLVALVDALYEGRRFEAARESAEELLRLARSLGAAPIFEFGAWYQLGRCLVALGRPLEAIKYFQQCVDYREGNHPGSPKNQEFADLLAEAQAAVALDDGASDGQ